MIGTLAVKGVSVIGSDQDDTVVVPYTSAMKRILGVKTLGRITLSVEKGKPLAPALDRITELLAQRHRIGPDREVDFFVRSQEEIATMAVFCALDAPPSMTGAVLDANGASYVR